MRSLSLSNGVLFGALFAMILISTSLLSISTSQTEMVQSSAVISNDAPDVVFVWLSDVSFGSRRYSGGVVNSLVAGGTKSVFLTGVVEDMNGQFDIVSVDAAFYRSGVTGGPDCDPLVPNDCYSVSGCDIDEVEVSDTKRRFSCPIDIWYYADSTMMGGEFPDQNWQASVTVRDTDDASSTDDSFTIEMQTLLAVNFDLEVNYGSLAPGETTDVTSEVVFPVHQFGNDRADVEVSFSTEPGAPSYGGTMDCVHTGGAGFIPSGRQQWSVEPGGYDAPWATGLTDEQAIVDLDLPYRHGANPIEYLYWNISIPSTGASGECEGQITVSAVSH